MLSFHIKKRFLFWLGHSQLLINSVSHLFIVLKLAKHFTSLPIEDITEYFNMSFIFLQFRIPKKLNLLGLHLGRWIDFPLNKLSYPFSLCLLINSINKLFINKLLFILFHAFYILYDRERF
jgi:hypothetical protein